MNNAQRTRQMQAIHIEYARLWKEGTLQALHTEARESCHLWATAILGRLVPTLKTLSDYELNTLRDALTGKDSKILQRITQEFEKCGIKNPEAWVATLAKSDSMKAWRGLSIAKLPVSQQYRLLKMLERRGSSRARTQRVQNTRSRGRVTGRAMIPDEQRSLWGM